MTNIYMPRFDPAMETARIIEWIRKEGDRVRKGEPIVKVEGEKTTFEVESPIDGVITKIMYPENSEVKAGSIIAIISEQAVEGGEKPRVKATPIAKRIAEEHGINLSMVKGSGPDGRITKDDVIREIEKAKFKPIEAATVKIGEAKVLRRLRLSGLRKTISERLTYSHKTIPSASIAVDVDFEELIKLREMMEKSINIDISLTAFIVKAVAKALRKHIMLNSSIEGDEVTVYDSININVAIHTEDGLVAPVIFNAEAKSIEEISKEIKTLTEKAERRQLTLEMLTGGTFTVTNLGPYGVDTFTGGTFTVTNLGPYGVDTFTPIINPPQTAILGVGSVKNKVVVEDNDLVLKPMTTLTLVFNHQVIDGVPAAKFLDEVKKNLENPLILILK